MPCGRRVWRDNLDAIRTRWLTLQTKARLAQVERHVVELDAEIAALIAAGQTTARNRDILCSMPGIGTVTAAAMLTLMPEIGTLERK
jgi:transposase